MIDLLYRLRQIEISDIQFHRKFGDYYNTLQRGFDGINVPGDIKTSNNDWCF